MSFLAPLFLFGALAVAGPFIFHLVRRTTRREQPFSAVWLLRPSPPRLTRRRRLEQVALLILRGAVVLLLALAFARPFWRQPPSALPEMGVSRQTVILLDTSASMRREDLWRQAVARAIRIARQSGPGDQLALMTFDRQPQVRFSFERWDSAEPSTRASQVQETLATLGPGWGATDLGQALVAAVELLEESAFRRALDAARRIVVLSDLQAGSRVAELSGFSWPPNLEVDLEPIRPRATSNAGVQWIAQRPGSSASREELRVRVTNSDDARRDELQLRWSTSSDAVRFQVAPGQSRVVRLPSSGDSPPRRILELEGDDHDFDNRLFIVQPEREEITVVFAGSDAEMDPAGLHYYLDRALGADPRRTVRLDRVAPSAVLAPELLERARLVIRTDPPSEEQVPALAGYLEQGGAMLCVLKSAEGGRNLAALAGVPALELAEGSPRGYLLLGTIAFEHPLFAAFADPRYSDFTRIHTWRYRRLSAPDPARVRVLAAFDNGDPALVEFGRGRGHLWVLTTGWQPTDSQWALSSKFPPLLHSMIDYAGGQPVEPSQHRVGDAIRVPGGDRPGARTVQDPDGAELALATGAEVFSRTDQPGFYGVVAEDWTWTFAVNLDPSESRTRPLELDQLEQLGIPLTRPERLSETKAARQSRLEALQSESRQKLWRWLIAVVLVLLVGESFLAGWLGRSAKVSEHTAH